MWIIAAAGCGVSPRRDQFKSMWLWFSVIWIALSILHFKWGNNYRNALYRITKTISIGCGFRSEYKGCIRFQTEWFSDHLELPIKVNTHFVVCTHIVWRFLKLRTITLLIEYRLLFAINLLFMQKYRHFHKRGAAKPTRLVFWWASLVPGWNSWLYRPTSLRV